MIRKLGLTAGTIAIAGFAAFFSASAAAQSAKPASLEDQPKEQFKPVKLGSRGQTVLDPGTVLTIQQGGLVGISPWLIVVCPSSYRAGKMHSPNAICLMATRNVTHDLTKGEKVYVENINVDQKKDKIEFEVVECDSCNGNRSAYKSKIAFEFSKGQLKGADLAEVTGVIVEVFSVDPPADSTQVAQNTPGQPSKVAGGPEATDQAAPQSVLATEASAAPAKPIQVGQTLEEVQANTGWKLDLTADLGSTQIYRYNGRTIKFKDGKVTDIQ